MGRLKVSKNGVRTLIAKLCQACGKQFFVEPWKDRQGDAVSCSRKCQADWHSKTARKPTIRKCPTCSTNFITKPRSKQIYCSWACGNKVHGQKLRLKWDQGGFGIRQRLPKLAKCKICGKTFAPKQRTQVFCSRI